ncbi:MAG: CDP-diacylglycerol--serine O-phosphatidyltransferase [Burkholderiales bacterium]|nr:CDP-diacylglycerol--serine O-phosphatidyltransferase [Burkholderiales bacterium]
MKRVKGSPIYLVPSLITLSSMCFGVYAMVQSIQGNFYNAGIAIFLSMILDGLDGRVARMTKTTSAFGAELDSLADMVAFGVAPALIIFNWGLNYMGLWGWSASFIYCACAAIRLARFNSSSSGDSGFFLGLPSPSAAALVVGFVFIAGEYHLHLPVHTTYHLAMGITIFAAISMITNVKFYGFKEFNFHHRAPFRALLLFLVLIVMITYYPELVVYGFFVLYVVVSYILWISSILRAKK